MRIGYYGDGPWAHLALEKIIQSDELEIAFIVARYDNKDPVLAKYAGQLRVPFITHPNVNSQEFINMVAEYKVDINVSMSFNQILKKELIESAPKGFINCHAGALPFYRGHNVLNWAIINGEKQFGVTVHYIDTGIDTGDIILQRFVPIELEDDYGNILVKAIKVCAQTLYDALLAIQGGNVTRIKQSSIHPVGFYCARRRNGDEFINWEWSSARIYNFIRAITIPGPCAQTKVNDKLIAIVKAEMIENAPNYIGRVGEVVGRDNEGIVVKTGDNTIKIVKINDLQKQIIPRLSIGQVLA